MSGDLLYLVTGFPKLLARRLAQTILAHTPDSQVALLVQEKHAPEAQAFADALAAGRARVLVGDVSSMHLGLSTSEYKELAQGCTDIVHAAEWGHLGADRLLLERVNIEGTRAALELAQDCRKLRRLTHVSTVFVSGDRVGVVAEDELSAGQSFRNPYEETKFEAELLVRRAMGQLPCTVLRPSIVVGDSKTGEIDPCSAAPRLRPSAGVADLLRRFEGPYAIAILLVTSPVSVPLPLPGDGVAPLNVVPIDFVASAAAAIHHHPRAVGRTFHIVDPNPSSSRRVYELVAQREGKRLPRLSLGYKLTDALLKLPGLERLTREQRMAIAYVNHLSFFSSRNTLEILDGTGVRCPPIESYLDSLIQYVREAYKKKEPDRDPGGAGH
jgi:thioester reductase-like protein